MQKSTNTKYKGNLGEDIAIDFLIGKGYRIFARNYVYKKKEIDIIALDKNTVVFVEVKERGTNVFGEPFEAVNIKKQRSIIMVANEYIKRNNIDLESRFDIISITMEPQKEPHIEHIVNAFSPMA